MITVLLWKPREGAARDAAEWAASLPHTRVGLRLRQCVGDAPCRILNLTPHLTGDLRPHLPWIAQHLDGDLVLAFGSVAAHVVPPLRDGPLICAPHPSALYLLDANPLFAWIRDHLDFRGRVLVNCDRANRIVQSALPRFDAAAYVAARTEPVYCDDPCLTHWNVRGCSAEAVNV